ncbi:MAG TPA: host attachment protein [Noviherbaspirillum sp.]
MDAAWIVSANAGRAMIYAQESAKGALREITDMANPAARLRTADTESDKIGPTAATKSMHNVGAATPGKTYEPNQTPEERQTELFARAVSDYLRQGQVEGRFKKLILVAGPEFLGALRQLMDPNVLKVVSKEINKDYTQYKPAQLLEMMQAHEAKA